MDSRMQSRSVVAPNVGDDDAAAAAAADAERRRKKAAKRQARDAGDEVSSDDDDDDDDMDTSANWWKNIVILEKPPIVEGMTPTLKQLIDLLRHEDYRGVIMLRKAMKANMRYKMDRYREIREGLEARLFSEEKRLKKQQNYLKLKSGAQQDNWSIYSTISDKLREMIEDVEKMLAIEEAAFDTYEKLDLHTIETYEMLNDPLSGRAPAEQITTRRDRLVAKLETMKCFASNNPYVVEAVAGVVLGFMRKPELVHTKFMNWMFVGKAGTGKTTIARSIAQVFAAAGIFIYDDVLESGRGDFVAGFMGATTERTNSRMLAALDRVHFVDEAYAIAGKGEGKGETEAYGLEAIATIVDFCTKFKGLHCLMFAGYEQQMRDEFLAANEGLDRRIPYKYNLADYTAKELVVIFQRTLLTEQGIDVDGCGETAVADAKRFYTYGAWYYLEKFLQSLIDKGPNDVRFKDLYQIIKAQAGAMTNLAEMAVIDIAGRRADDALVAARCPSEEDRIEPSAGTLEDMVELLRRSVIKMALSEEVRFVDLFKTITDDIIFKMMQSTIQGESNPEYQRPEVWERVDDPTRVAREARQPVDCDAENALDQARKPERPKSKWEEEAKRLRAALAQKKRQKAAKAKLKLLQSGPLHAIPLWYNRDMSDKDCAKVLALQTAETPDLGKKMLMLHHLKIAESMRIGKGLVFKASYGSYIKDWANRAFTFAYDAANKQHTITRKKRYSAFANIKELLAAAYTRAVHNAVESGKFVVPEEGTMDVGGDNNYNDWGTVSMERKGDPYPDEAAQAAGDAAKAAYYEQLKKYKEYKEEVKKRAAMPVTADPPPPPAEPAEPERKRPARVTRVTQTAPPAEPPPPAAPAVPVVMSPLMAGFNPDHVLLTLLPGHNNENDSPNKNAFLYMALYVRIEYYPEQRQRRFIVSVDSILFDSCPFGTRGYPNPDQFQSPRDATRAQILEHGAVMDETDSDGGHKKTAELMMKHLTEAIKELLDYAEETYKWQIEQTKNDVKARLNLQGAEAAMDDGNGAEGQDDDDDDDDDFDDSDDSAESDDETVNGGEPMEEGQ